MEEKKNNKGLIWLIVVLIIMILGLVGYIVYDKVLLNDKNPINNNNTNTTTTENSSIENEREIKLTKTSTNGIEVSLQYNDNGCSLTIDNKDINSIKKTHCEYVMSPEIDLYEGFLILVLYDPVDSNNNLIAFDYEGNVLFNDSTIIIEGKDYLNNRWADLNHSYYAYNFKVDETKINYTVRYYNDSCQLKSDNCDPNTENYLSCNELKELGENIFDIRNYEIAFNGKTFDEPKLISSTKLKDSALYKTALEECQ